MGMIQKSSNRMAVGLFRLCYGDTGSDWQGRRDGVMSGLDRSYLRGFQFWTFAVWVTD